MTKGKYNGYSARGGGEGGSFFFFFFQQKAPGTREANLKNP